MRIIEKLKNIKNIKNAKEAVGGKAVKASTNKINARHFPANAEKKFVKYFNTNIKKPTSLNFFVILATNPSENLITRLTEFYHLWPLQQWVSSLVGLIALYWATGYFYNRWLSDKGGWLSWERRIWLIAYDFLINLSLGLYYMNYRETVLGAMMLKCPIAISPLIFILELVCFYIYCRFFINKKNEKKKNNKN